MVERERVQCFGEPRQLVIVRCKEAAAFVDLMHRLDHRPGEREPVVGRGAAPDLVEDDEALRGRLRRSEEHTSELQSLMRISYAVFCLKKKKKNKQTTRQH